MILNIITAPEPILRQKSLEIEKVDDSIKNLMDNMVNAMYHDDGVGLAAVQVGKLHRVIVVDLQSLDDNDDLDVQYPIKIANPTIMESSDEMILAQEGCLSLPEQCVEVSRAESIKLSYLDYNNNQCQLEAKGWLARVLQHEIDHLDGKLLIDYLSTIKKDVALRKLKRMKKSI